MTTCKNKFMWISLLALPLKEKKIRFEKSLSELTLYVKKLEKATTLIVSLYVDDLLVARNCDDLVKEFKLQMEKMFVITNLKELRYFLGMEKGENQQACPWHLVKRLTSKKILRGSMRNYKSVIGFLFQLITTRPDIMYVIGLLICHKSTCQIRVFEYT
ncbi:laccase-2-like [Gossypium australe]|uniref:Laccase-2-like n=1 Tax=Gossypium australe TaxID=47621 RepID=A0A5B6VKN6_9ROSI|nr:laccase-2-like [Gossypium australe]